MSAIIIAAAQRLRESQARHGLAATLHFFTARLLSRLLFLQVSEVIYLDRDTLVKRIDTTPDGLPDEFDFHFLSPAEVTHFAKNRTYELGPEFVRMAANGQHLCFAAVKGDCLAAYGWYALYYAEPGHNLGTGMSFPSDTAYMFKGFTMREYRGKRLHGTCMALALQQLGGRGIKRLISTVEWSNHASLRSCKRLGYKRLGRLWSIRGRENSCIMKPRAPHRLGIGFGANAPMGVYKGKNNSTNGIPISDTKSR